MRVNAAADSRVVREKIQGPSARGVGSRKALAGKSTLNRLELGKKEGPDKYHKILPREDQIDTWMVDAFIPAHECAPDEIVRFFRGYYGNYCYLPLYIFSGEHLCPRLRRSNIDGADGVGQLAPQTTTSHNVASSLNFPV